MTKFATGHFLGAKLGRTKEAFWPRRPYLPPGEAQQEWTVQVMGVLEAEENAISEKTFGR